MKVLLSTVITLLAFMSSWAQDITSHSVQTDASEIAKNEIVVTKIKDNAEPVALEPFRFAFLRAAGEPSRSDSGLTGAATRNPYKIETAKCCNAAGDAADDERASPDDSINPKEKFHWKPALAQSIAFLAFQHSFRMTQEKTRDGLRGGPFFR